MHIGSSRGDSVLQEAVLAAMLVSRELFSMKGVIVVYDEYIDPFQAARDPVSEATMSRSKIAFGHEPTLTATFRCGSGARMHHAAFDR